MIETDQSKIKISLDSVITKKLCFDEMKNESYKKQSSEKKRKMNSS